MQDLENNMDELLRKAADKYQLKAGASNWDAIVPQLVTNSIVPATQKKNNLKRYTLLLLLLFLIAGGIYTTYMVTKTNLNVLPKPSEKNSMVNSNKKADIMNKEEAEVYKKQKQKIETGSEINYPLRKNEGKESVKNMFAGKTNSGSVALNKFKKMGPTDSYQVSKIDRNKISLQEAESILKMASEKSAIRQFDLTNLTVPDVSGKMAKANTKIVQRGNSEDSQSALIRERGQQQNKHGIYVGVVVGPSLNEVKSQGLKKTGFDIGIIAGYQLNSKMSIETGLLFAKKYYFSDGKYFSPGKTNISMPASMKVLSLEGSSAVIEVPVKLKYDFAKGNIRNWFFTTGFSSYILTHENNDYRALINGSQQELSVKYKHKMSYFPGAVNLSIGHEFKTGKQTKFRIEPYLQIPLKGIGVGSMPVTTTGLHIGITNLLHR